jgi:hypothetical protein
LYCLVTKTPGKVYKNPTFNAELSWNHAVLQPIHLKKAIESVGTKLISIQLLLDCIVRCEEHFRNNHIYVIRYSLQSPDWTRKKIRSQHRLIIILFHDLSSAIFLPVKAVVYNFLGKRLTNVVCRFHSWRTDFDNSIGYKYASHVIWTHCEVFSIVWIYFYTRITFLLRSWSSKPFNFSQCISYIKEVSLEKPHMKPMIIEFVLSLKLSQVIHMKCHYQ